MPCTVRRVRRETYDTFTLELEPHPASGPSVRNRKGQRDGFAPGQFNMLYVFGKGEVPISISGDPGKPDQLIHTVRAVGSVTQAICASKRGHILGVRGPFGSRWPVDEAAGSDVVIVAGGIGLAPLRPAIYHVLSHRGEYGRVALLYGARTPSDLLYRSELEKLRGRFDLEVEVTVDSAKANEWHGHVGVVTTLIPKASFDPLHTIAMVCGPEIMMRFTILELQKRGIPPERIFVSMERNMKCAVGFCGHCQYGPTFICKDGPVFRFDAVQGIFGKREI
jgi:NAD(P)H-flavin reductase